MLHRALRVPALTALVIVTLPAAPATVSAQVDTGIRPAALFTGSTDGLGRQIARELTGPSRSP